MPKFYVPEIFLGALLAAMIFAMGMAFESSRRQPTSAQAKSGTEQVQTAHKPEPFSLDWLTHDGVVFFTAVLALIAGAQAGLFLWQLRYMRKGMDDAKIAAQAAQTSANTAKLQAEIAQTALGSSQDTARRQLRAYMGIRNSGTTFSRGQVTIYTVNYGQTPAHNATMYIHIREMKPAGKPDYSACKKETGPQIIHPGQAFGKIVGKETPTDTFFLCGYVDYIDAFETQWRYHFGFSHDPERTAFDGSKDETWNAEEGYNYEEKRT